MSVKSSYQEYLPREEDDPKSSYENPRTVLAQLMLDRIMNSVRLERLRKSSTLLVILKTSSKEGVFPLVHVGARRWPFIQFFAYGTDVASFGDTKLVLETLSGGTPAVIVSDDPEGAVPASLLAVADETLDFPPVDRPMLASLSRRCLKGRSGDLTPELVATMNFDQVCAVLASGTSARSAAKRLRRFSDAKAVVALPAANIADLENALGYGSAKSWAESLRMDISAYRERQIPWSEVDSGAVFFGPTGTGKSTFAHIIAKSCGIPIIHTSIADLFATSSGYLDGVIKAQRKMFEEAVSRAPCLLFLDELDALPNRASISSRGKDWWTPVILDFLIQLDRLSSRHEGVVVLGATNRIEDVDAAVLRPGRLERTIYIGPPGPGDLAGILRQYLKDDLENVDLLPLAFANPLATGADAMQWCRAARRSARYAKRAMIHDDLARQVLAADSRTSDEIQRVAIHEAGHAVMSVLLGWNTVKWVSVQKSSAMNGYTNYELEVRDPVTLEMMERRVMCILAGRAAEVEMLPAGPSALAGGDNRSDLALATAAVTAMHSALGLSGSLRRT